MGTEFWSRALETRVIATEYSCVSFRQEGRWKRIHRKVQRPVICYAD
jgi:hypothetical protein